MQERKNKWTVGEWMTQNPQTIPADTSVRDAFIQMRSGGFRHLLVVENNKLLGIVTDRDLRRPDITKDVEGWNDYYNLDDDYEVRYIMTINVHTLRTGDSLEKALKLFIENKYGAAPVLDKHDNVIGILSNYDALRAFDAALKLVGDILQKK